ncbi:poly-beta-1,6 N-acetyl-D-glucosamine export porin PgaA [Acinetobacter qingfengensis]|uniref:poly-beta-1,6 N-acetyl-D-glucosamine export porin PgaA n=1 Tax=Acinetobacter qingfengensis TaxID=1262585 RepID=UPI0009D6B405|nr:poly-beta-1,6 N-acetyl-D-glucosamine export porin PgaA [Acinetobacter qingfengensis]KAA8734363.1 poly-beta-1,6 N-acetyl-D-glucosamine export porin PgaA [Acinetobacter qingfengensis]
MLHIRKILIKRFRSLSITSIAVLSAQNVIAQSLQQDHLTAEREQAVLLVRQGNVDQGLQQLKRLLQQYPYDQLLLADYLTLASQQDRFSSKELGLLNFVQLQQFPEYAYLPVVQGLRNTQQFDQALFWAKKFNQQRYYKDLILIQAVLYAELKDTQHAVQLLVTLPLSQLKVDQLIQVSYAYRISEKPVQSLDAATRAYQKAPDQWAVQEEYVRALLSMGGVTKAFHVIKEIKKKPQQQQLYLTAKLLQFSQDINFAISRYRFLSAKGEPDVLSYADFDHVLNTAAQLKQQVIVGSPEYFNFYYNYIYALSVRRSSKQAIFEAQKLNKPIDTMPAYVRHALADSYLALKQPKIAEKLYLGLLNEKNYPDMTVYSGLYYSYIEQEKYQQAQQFIQKVDRLIPVYQYSAAKGVDRTTAPDRYDYIGLTGLDLAYRNQLDLAERYYQSVTNKAPNNAGYLNNLVQIQRWREQPLTAQKTLERLNGMTPVDKSTRINQIQNTQAAGDIQAWKRQLHELNQYYPNDGSVILSTKEFNDRSRFSIQHETNWGRSRQHDQITESLKGNHDRTSNTRLNAPWIFGNYRIFATHQDRSAEYESGSVRDQRYGFGLEWASKRKNLSVALTQDTDQHNTGIMLNWSQWLNDHWQYSLAYNSQAAIALQAIRDRYDGQSYTAGITWQQNESRSANINYLATDVLDGNFQQDLSASFTQRLFALPHHITDMTIAAGIGSNRSQNVNYFSPENYYAASLNFSHDWLTWRWYERSFTQQFDVGAGFYHQQDYGAKLTWNVQYLHLWSLSRTWKLSYGIGLSQHPYDGKQERYSYGLFGFQGIF